MWTHIWFVVLKINAELQQYLHMKETSESLTHFLSCFCCEL